MPCSAAFVGGASLRVQVLGGGRGTNQGEERGLERTWPWSSALPPREVSLAQGSFVEGRVFRSHLWH